MPNEAASNARRKVTVKPPLQITDLSHCIKATLKQEPLFGYNFGTPTPQPASREQTLSKLAPVLFLQLEKTGRSRTPVRFPLRLHLEDDSGPQPYLLTALILHPPHHFTANIRDPATGLWHACNDATVKSIPTPSA